MSFDLYSHITGQISAMLERGVVPWRSPILGRGTAGYPRNLESRRPYRGVNVFLLAMTGFAKGYSSSYWLTFRQAKENGGTVKKGEAASMVVFWKQLEVADKASGEKKRIPVLRYYNVFNVEQCDGVPAPDTVTFSPADFRAIDGAERIVRGFEDAPTIEHGGSQAFYRPATDTVRMPEPSRFLMPEEYYSTLFHELGHSTGHPSRLNRSIDVPKPFGSLDYGKEELVAEMTAAFLCGQCSIEPAVIENQAAYVAGWLKRMKEDAKLIVHAAGAAQRAADWILGGPGRTTDLSNDESPQPMAGQ